LQNATRNAAESNAEMELLTSWQYYADC